MCLTLLVAGPVLLPILWQDVARQATLKPLDLGRSAEGGAMADHPLDLLTATVKVLVEHGKQQCSLTQAEIDAAFAGLRTSHGIEVDPALIEDVVAMLQEMGIDIIDGP